MTAKLLTTHLGKVVWPLETVGRPCDWASVDDLTDVDTGNVDFGSFAMLHVLRGLLATSWQLPSANTTKFRKTLTI